MERNARRVESLEADKTHEGLTFQSENSVFTQDVSEAEPLNGECYGQGPELLSPMQNSGWILVSYLHSPHPVIPTFIYAPSPPCSASPPPLVQSRVMAITLTTVPVTTSPSLLPSPPPMIELYPEWLASSDTIIHFLSRYQADNNVLNISNCVVILSSHPHKIHSPGIPIL